MEKGIIADEEYGIACFHCLLKKLNSLFLLAKLSVYLACGKQKLRITRGNLQRASQVTVRNVAPMQHGIEERNMF